VVGAAHARAGFQGDDCGMENEIKKLGTDFSESALRPKWEALDATDASLREEILKQAAAAGIFGFMIPDLRGGSGLGAAEFGVFIGEVAKASGGAAMLLAAHLAGIAPLLLSGNDNAGAFFSEITRAEASEQPLLFAAALRENAAPEFISGQIDTTISRENGGCVVNGVKTRVAGAGAAAYFSVLARDTENGSLCWVVVPRGAIGVEVRTETARLGLKICPVNDVSFIKVEVPAENVVMTFSEEDRLRDLYQFTDPVFAAIATGMAAEARDIAINYSLSRYQGGKMICGHDVIRNMLAEMDMKLCACRALAGSGESGILASAFAAEAAEAICLDAVQVLGGYGYMKDYRVERILRDAKSFRAMINPRARLLHHACVEIEKMK
jgi:acyl-CoA dehydrogenase